MNKRPILRRTAEDNYVSSCGLTLQREYGETPNGNALNGRWVLRSEGNFIDFDKYRYDLAERNDICIDFLDNVSELDHDN